MATLIRNRRLAADSWQRLEGERWLRADESGLVPDLPQDADLLAPLSLWRIRRDDFLLRRGRNGLRLASQDDPAAIASDLPQLALIALDFPSLGDGRGYSTARLLRERLRYKGELRAVGDVGRDQLLFLARCGFDTFELRDGADAQDAIAAFGELAEQYQSSVTEPLPLFRRRPVPLTRADAARGSRARVPAQEAR